MKTVDARKHESLVLVFLCTVKLFCHPIQCGCLKLYHESLEQCIVLTVSHCARHAVLERRKLPLWDFSFPLPLIIYLSLKARPP